MRFVAIAFVLVTMVSIDGGSVSLFEGSALLNLPLPFQELPGPACTWYVVNQLW